MAKYKFKSNLSVDGINDLISQINKYKNDTLPNKIDTFVRRLSEYGVEVAKADVVSLEAVFTGELYNSIFSQKGLDTKTTKVYFVVADSKHAAFVEFGTGTNGQELPYIGEFPEGVEWNYNSGSTIRQLADGRYGWFYPRDGKWYFTEGMPSRPFMYFAGSETRKAFKKVVKEVFG